MPHFTLAKLHSQGCLLCLLEIFHSFCFENMWNSMCGCDKAVVRSANVSSSGQLWNKWTDHYSLHSSSGLVWLCRYGAGGNWNGTSFTFHHFPILFIRKALSGSIHVTHAHTHYSSHLLLSHSNKLGIVSQSFKSSISYCLKIQNAVVFFLSFWLANTDKLLGCILPVGWVCRSLMKVLVHHM